MMQSKKSKRITWQLVLIWGLFVSLMAGVGVVGTSILINGPKIYTVAILIALFVLSFFGGRAHGYIHRKLHNEQEQEETQS